MQLSLTRCIALKLFLEEKGEHADVVSTHFKCPTHLAFIPKTDSVKGSINNLHNYIIKANVKETGIDQLAYDIKNGELSIFISPQKGTFQQDDFTFTHIPYRYDLIFVIDTPVLQSLGEIYTQNSELFFDTPVISIDNDPSNEHFGHINLIELTATSSAEVLYHMIQELDEHAFNKDIATCLLTGIVAETKSFKTPHVSPHTLSVAARLVEMGAKREDIVEQLYRTRSLPTLKLWGRALAHLENDAALGLVWTSVTRDDFTHSGTAEEHLPAIIDDLISNTPEAKVSAVFYECPGNDGRVCALVSSEKQFDAKLLTKPFAPQGTKNQVRLEFMGKPLHEVRDLVVNNIKKLLAD